MKSHGPIATMCFLIFAATILPSCGESDPTGDKSPTQEKTYQKRSVNVDGSGVRMNINGVNIFVDLSAGFTYHSKTTNNISITEIKIGSDGRLDIVDGELRIGDKSYDKVKSGDKVVISAEGIQINGRNAGPLPDTDSAED